MILDDFQIVTPRPLSPEGRIIEDQSEVICSLLTHNLKKKIRTPDFSKIVILVNHSDKTENHKAILGVLTVHADFPVEKYLQMPMASRGPFLLEFVTGVVKSELINYEVDPKLIEEASEKAARSGFHQWFCTKRVYEPGTRRAALIQADQGIESAEISIVVFEPSRGDRKIHIASTSPNRWMYSIYLGDIIWTGNQKLQLTKCNGEVIEIDLNQN